MTRTGVLLRIECKKCQVVVTEDRVYCQGRTPSSDEVWSVPRARVAGVRTHSGLLLAELDVRTRDGEAFTAPGVGAFDALRAIDLLGYSPDHMAEPPAPPSDRRPLELVCGEARLVVTETEVEWTGERPWRLLCKEIAGVAAQPAPPVAKLAFHTFGGRICRAQNVPLYGAVRIIERLGYAPDDDRAHYSQGGAGGATRAPRAANPTNDRARSVHATRRTVRGAPRGAGRRKAAPTSARGPHTKGGPEPATATRQRAASTRGRFPPVNWLVAIAAGFSHLIVRHTQ
ncbi:MAG TPA: hypothetical protein VJN88_14780 [Ktedonobacterales bacterium]|nr:hypothetical protein [Ktedonobacterales bacterium]